MSALLGFFSLQGRRGLWPIGGSFEFSALGREISLFLGRPEGGSGVWFRRGHLASIGVCFFLLCLGSALSGEASGLSTFVAGGGSFISVEGAAHWWSDRDDRAACLCLEQALVVLSDLLFGCVGDSSMPELVVGGDADLLRLLAGNGISATAGGRSDGGSAAWCGLVQGLAWWSPDGDGVALQPSSGGAFAPLMFLAVDYGNGALCWLDGGCGHMLLLGLLQLVVGLGFSSWLWAFVFIFYILFDRGPATSSSSV